MHVYYQIMICNNAHIDIPELHPVDSMGSKRSETGFKPHLMSLSPIPSACSLAHVRHNAATSAVNAARTGCTAQHYVDVKQLTHTMVKTHV